ncbi:MurR/RpiR family transcriptional regulator [Cryobacterium sp. CG_9.6]|uniref:MurR/RpiR family transcriptional regulator n=1 Tax=Cryobacterium sp. CG_9.6 TaxID=2760710 RepID=UPI0024741016|nr:MurR/RpiR family transcriptional regulator [Cryobacterium sp. CG_9.6]MDH6236331.1 DNA-binding MurR/RpiR family transcriptional regulator [Cryobacterium sp. CG_9.6]
MGETATNPQSARSAAGVMARLRTALPALGPSEQRVLQVIVTQPASVMEYSTVDLAAAAHTSPATVIRACQNAGFRGFQDLRLELARSPQEEPAGQHVLDDVFAGAEDAIRVSRDKVDHDRFDRAVHALSTGARIVMVGTGFSSPPIQDAALRFLTSGRPVEAPVDVLAQQFAARLLGVGDVCVAVSYSGANRHTLAACSAAQEGGATIIAVTSFSRSPLVTLSDIALITGPVARSHDVDPFLSRLSHSIVLHALHFAVLQQMNGDGLVSRMRGAVAEVLSDDTRGYETSGLDSSPPQ